MLSLEICWERDWFCGSKNSLGLSCFPFWSDLLCICYLILNLWMPFSPGLLTRPTCVLDKDCVWARCKDSPRGCSLGDGNQPATFLAIIAVTGVTALVRHTLSKSSLFFTMFGYIETVERGVWERCEMEKLPCMVGHRNWTRPKGCFHKTAFVCQVHVIKICVRAIHLSTGLHHLHKPCSASRDVMPGKPAVSYFQSWLRVKPNQRTLLDIRARLQVSGLHEQVSGGASTWL